MAGYISPQALGHALMQDQPIQPSSPSSLSKDERKVRNAKRARKAGVAIGNAPSKAHVGSHLYSKGKK